MAGRSGARRSIVRCDLLVPVIRRGSYQGRELRRGELLRVSPLEAAILRRLGLISLTPHRSQRTDRPSPTAPSPPAPELVTAAPPEEVAIPTRRRYRRRDLEAE